MIAGQTKNYTIKDLLDYNAGRPPFLYVMIKAAKLTYAKAKKVIDNIVLDNHDDDQILSLVMRRIHQNNLINNFNENPYIMPENHRNFMARLQEDQNYQDNEDDRTRISRILNNGPLTDEETLQMILVVFSFMRIEVNMDVFIPNLVQSVARRTDDNSTDYYLNDLLIYARDNVARAEDISVYLYITIKATRIKFSEAKKIINDARNENNFLRTTTGLRLSVMKWIRSKGLQDNFTDVTYPSVDLTNMLSNHENITEDMSDFDRIVTMLDGNMYNDDLTFSEISRMGRIRRFFSKNEVSVELWIFEIEYTREHLMCRLKQISGQGMNAGYSLFLYFIHRVCQECYYDPVDAIVFASKFRICFDTETYVTDRLDNETAIRAYINGPSVSTPFINELKDFYAGTIRILINEEVPHRKIIAKLDKWMGYRIFEE